MLDSIGERITFARSATNMTQRDFANSIGMSQSNLSNIEAGRVSPSLEIIYAISLALDIYIDWLAFGVGEVPDIRKSHDSFTAFCDWFYKSKKDPGDTVHLLIKIMAIRLKAYRKQHNLSQIDIAAKIDISQSSYSLIELAKANFPVGVLEKIVNGLDISGDWLLYGFEQSQKDILFPSDWLKCKKESDMEQIYKEKLVARAERNAHIIYNSYKISKDGMIPHRNLTEKDVDVIVELILQIEFSHDQGFDVSDKLKQIKLLIQDFKRQDMANLNQRISIEDVRGRFRKE